MADLSHTHYQDGRRPPERVPKSERILNLISVLLRSEEPLPVTEILGKVTGYDDAASRESLMRRFERDKKVLRDIGIPIEHASPGTFGQEGYRISPKHYFLDRLQLPPESGQLLRLLYAWAHADGGELSADLRSALVKLGFLVDEQVPQAEPLAPVETLEAQRIDPKLSSGPVVGKNLELLSEAVLRQKRVRFRYYTMKSDAEYELQVDPYGLGFSGQAWNRGAWYLVGRSHLARHQDEPVRVFKVQRIRREARFVNQRDAADYEIPLGFRVREHIGKVRWEFHDLGAAFRGSDEATEPFVARVGFEAAVAPEVRSLVPFARDAGRKGRHELLEFEVHQRRPFLRFLLRYVPRVRIVSPPELEPALRALAREVLARYGKARA